MRQNETRRTQKSGEYAVKYEKTPRITATDLKENIKTPDEQVGSYVFYKPKRVKKVCRQSYSLTYLFKRFTKIAATAIFTASAIT